MLRHGDGCTAIQQDEGNKKTDKFIQQLVMMARESTSIEASLWSHRSSSFSFIPPTSQAKGFSTYPGSKENAKQEEERLQEIVEQIIWMRGHSKMGRVAMVMTGVVLTFSRSRKLPSKSYIYGGVRRSKAMEWYACVIWHIWYN
jgi:hypothetical protein